MLRENPRPVLQVGTSPRMPLREHLKNFYFLFFGSNFNRCIVAASLMLLLISFVSTASVSTLWYHVMEGILTFLFAGEIALRLAVMRSNFWESAYNISEVVACVLCITIFFILHFSRQQSSRTEHQVLIILRYLGQLLRMIGVVAADTMVSTSGEGGIQLFSANSTKPSSTDLRETYRDVL
ncbi:hypothetical protein C3747_2g353 [Trypanosoma cruzi]|uniref:Ion transport domain-containing protein n=2 Tax=Trypanosoma cruzi TaxID=5693 RepID=Q4DM91_TRYCC|nr:hypothetical protein, conserved [Trypanosoma cruzi]EAN93630.1 hypothetical protein, conserved [Trypanosoma cruzi]PWV21742.1 hypothetical protein C3747_2g353 [Trypanosoma cruzi]|eukprot:XP_815481.1 hypothetical protein [Trypanosoma cruzi strain CL Brener]